MAYAERRKALEAVKRHTFRTTTSRVIRFALENTGKHLATDDKSDTSPLSYIIQQRKIDTAPAIQTAVLANLLSQCRAQIPRIFPDFSRNYLSYPSAILLLNRLRPLHFPERIRARNIEMILAAGLP